MRIVRIQTEAATGFCRTGGWVTFKITAALGCGWRFGQKLPKTLPSSFVVRRTQTECSKLRLARYFSELGFTVYLYHHFKAIGD
jgi:hypothetical protein